jgi:hypothetical protein
MWESVLPRLEQLKAIDRQCQAFGAAKHKYVLRPCLSESEIAAVEHRLGISLPASLHAFYSSVGDGVVGPAYGLKPSTNLVGYLQTSLYPGIEAIRRVAATRGIPPDSDGYFEAPRDVVSGLLSVIDEGCGHETCLITNGPSTGNVVYLSADGYVVETDQTLIDIYNDWLDREIERFEAVHSLMLAGKNYDQIKEEMATRFRDYRAGDRIVSIVNTAKPPALFGDGNCRIYCGATQFPWFDGILKEWQESHV